VVGFVLPFDRLLDMTRTVPSASANLVVATTWRAGKTSWTKKSIGRRTTPEFLPRAGVGDGRDAPRLCPVSRWTFARAGFRFRLSHMKRSLLLPLLLVATPAAAQASLQQRVEARLGEAATGTRFGLVVTDADGKEIVAVNPDGRFIPASNTKMFTTAAAYASLTGLDQPDAAGGAAVRIEGQRRHPRRAWRCAAVERSGLHRGLPRHAGGRDGGEDDARRQCVGDDTLFPDQRWSPGMSWNNIPSRSGTGISALTLDDNELVIEVMPGAIGARPGSTLPLPYYSVDNRVVTVAGSERKIGFDRAPNGTVLRLTGTIGADAKPETLRVGIDDPAHYAAWRLRDLLEARGVKVTGKISARHRLPMPDDDPEVRNGAPAARPPMQPALAKLTPPPLAEDVRITNKVSQNLHAELLPAPGRPAARQRIDRRRRDRGPRDARYRGRAAHCVGPVRRFGHVDLQPRRAARRRRRCSAGSRPSPGARHGARRCRSAASTARWRGASRERCWRARLFAKTGTINATNALSGYLIARSGKMLTFSSFANDVPADASATKFIDAALVLVAEAN
jgi:D-alanyl-D-alanine carboxypeptidase/D-alanyl-D-alanine-endopeptidase (penicillin-binding protein 4)